MQLCALVASNIICSSACTLAAAQQQVEDNVAESVNGFKEHDLETAVETERLRFLFSMFMFMFTCAVNNEYTGL